MAELIFTKGYLVVNSVDLSDHVQTLEVSVSAELQDVTAMGDTARQRKPGLTDWSMTATFFQDFAGGSVDATLFPLIGSTGFTLAARASSTAIRGATNPEFSGTAVLESYMPLSGSVGDALTMSVPFRSAGTALARDISAT